MYEGDGELGCLCGKAGTSHLCHGSAHSSGCVVNGYGCRLYCCTHSRARSREKCMEKAVLFGAQFLEAPQAEFGESLGRCSR